MDTPTDEQDALSRRLTNLSQEVGSLRSSLNALLLTTLVATAGIGVYMLQNLRTVHREAELLKGMAAKLADEDKQMSVAVTRLKDLAPRIPTSPRF